MQPQFLAKDERQIKKSVEERFKRKKKVEINVTIMTTSTIDTGSSYSPGYSTIP